MPPQSHSLVESPLLTGLLLLSALHPVTTCGAHVFGLVEGWCTTHARPICACVADSMRLFHLVALALVGVAVGSAVAIEGAAPNKGRGQCETEAHAVVRRTLLAEARDAQAQYARSQKHMVVYLSQARCSRCRHRCGDYNKKNMKSSLARMCSDAYCVLPSTFSRMLWYQSNGSSSWRVC